MKTTIPAAAALALALGSGCARMGESPEALAVNRVNRTYTKPSDEIWRAVMSTVKEFDLRVDKEEYDGLGGEAVARRANKDRVYIETRSLDGASSEVSVAVDPGDRNMAELLQNRIAEKLGVTAGLPSAAFSGASSVEGTYNQPLDTCTTAAVKAAESLKLPVNRKEVHDTWVRIEARQFDAIPVQIRLERTPKDQTRVVFLAGTSRSEDNQMLASRLKAEFERALPLAD